MIDNISMRQKDNKIDDIISSTKDGERRRERGRGEASLLATKPHNQTGSADHADLTHLGIVTETVNKTRNLISLQRFCQCNCL